MKLTDHIEILRGHIATLFNFTQKYPMLNDASLVCVHDICAEKNSMPLVTFYGERDGDKAMLLNLLGESDWKTDGHSEGWQHVAKTVDGVKVRIYQAYRIEPVSVLPREVPAYLLTGREAGIDLLSSEVREVSK